MHEEKRYFSLPDHSAGELIAAIHEKTVQIPLPYRYAYEMPLFEARSAATLSLVERAKQLLWIDIGFGNGDSLLTMAHQFPHILFLGVEVHPQGIQQLIAKIDAYSIKNIIVVQADAVVVLNAIAGFVYAHAITLFFSDPWPKKRHHKRRLLNETRFHDLATCMHPGALLCIATDWQNYADVIRDEIDRFKEFTNQFCPYAPRPFWRLPTKYEEKAVREGRVVRDFIAVRR